MILGGYFIQKRGLKKKIFYQRNLRGIHIPWKSPSQKSVIDSLIVIYIHSHHKINRTKCEFWHETKLLTNVFNFLDFKIKFAMTFWS